MGGKNVSVLLVGGLVRGWTQVTGLIIFVLGARVLGVADFGVYALAAAFTNILQIFLYSGIYEYALRCSKSDGLDETLWTLNLAVAAIGGLGTVAVGAAIAGASHQPAVAWLALALAPSSLIAGTAAWHEALVLRANRYDVYYKSWFFAETVAALMGVIFLLNGAKLYSLIGYRYIEVGLTLLGFIVLYPVPYIGKIKLNAAHQIMRFAAPIYGSRLMSALSNYGVDLILGILLGPAATGLYRVSSRVVSSFTEVVFQPLRVLAWIKTSQSKGRNPVRIILALAPLSRLAALTLWPASVIMAFIAVDVLTIGLGPRWRPAAFIIVSLLIARGLGVSEVFLEPFLATIGEGRRLLALRAGAIVVMLSTLFIFAPLGAIYTGLPSIIGVSFSTIGFVAIILKVGGVKRVIESLMEGALGALITLAVFVAGEAGIHFAGWNELQVHVVGALFGGLVISVMLFRHMRELKTLSQQARSKRGRVDSSPPQPSEVHGAAGPEAV